MNQFGCIINMTSKKTDFVETDFHRYAITTWYYDIAEREKAKEKELENGKLLFDIS